MTDAWGNIPSHYYRLLVHEEPSRLHVVRLSPGEDREYGEERFLSGETWRTREEAALEAYRVSQLLRLPYPDVGKEEHP